MIIWFERSLVFVSLLQSDRLKLFIKIIFCYFFLQISIDPESLMRKLLFDSYEWFKTKHRMDVCVDQNSFEISIRISVFVYKLDFCFLQIHFFMIFSLSRTKDGDWNRCVFKHKRIKNNKIKERLIKIDQIKVLGLQIHRNVKTSFEKVLRTFVHIFKWLDNWKILCADISQVRIHSVNLQTFWSYAKNI